MHCYFKLLDHANLNYPIIWSHWCPETQDPNHPSNRVGNGNIILANAIVIIYICIMWIIPLSAVCNQAPDCNSFRISPQAVIKLQELWMPSVCTCVSLHVSMHVYAFVCTCVCACMCVRMGLCVFVHVQVCMCVCMWTKLKWGNVHLACSACDFTTHIKCHRLHSQLQCFTLIIARRLELQEIA